MTNHRSVARHALILTLAMTLTSCLSDSDESATDVSLAITSPISTSEMDTTDPTVSLAGTASSDAGIYEVSWSNDRGGEGVADGTDSWQTNGVALVLGENKITVTAEDVAGETTSQSLIIHRESGENGSVTLAWNAPTARIDGSPLTNLAGYKIYYGRMSGVYDYEVEIDNPGVSNYVVEDLVSGDWYFALAAYDANGLESEHSNEVAQNII
ncbi:MAG: fibronectin type III domain-containing protein [Woeseia sp.]